MATPALYSGAQGAVAGRLAVRLEHDELRVLDYDALEDVRHVLGGVDRLLQALEQILPSDYDHRVDAAVEQRGHGLTRDPIALVLQPVDLDRVVRNVVEAAQPRDRLGDLPARCLE